MQQRPNPYARRPMTRREYEAIQRRRKQNIIAIGIMAAVAVLVIVGVVLILSPRKPAADVAVQTVSAGNVESGGTNVDLSDPADGGAEVVEETPVPTPTAVPTPRPEGMRSARIRVAGDIMVCESQLKAYKSNGYDFHAEFADITDILSNADYTIANMEGTVGQYNDRPYTGYPMFNCPETILETLKDNGIDFLTLANNHMLDRWFNGMKNTVEWVQKYGFDYVGAYRTKEERSTPMLYDVNGIRIGFVAYTHTTNTMEKACDPDAVEYGVPYLYKSDIAADIKRVKDAGAEVVIALPHWGKEYVSEPDSTQIQYAKKLAKAGADIIIGSHSHMVQPMGYQYLSENGKQRQIFIMFSMGNFLSDHILERTDCGIVLDFTINEREDGSFTCDDVGYIPTYNWQPTEGDVRILATGRYLNNPPSGMSDETYNRMVASYYETTEIFGDNFRILSE